jgi:hypothetical protein
MAQFANTRRWVAGIVLTAVIGGAAMPAHGAQRYKTFDLGTFFPLGMNDKGVVVGNNNGDLVVSDNFHFGDVSRVVHGNTSQIGLDINNNNVMVGFGLNSETTRYIASPST